MDKQQNWQAPPPYSPNAAPPQNNPQQPAYTQPPAGAYTQPPPAAYTQPPAGAYTQPPAGGYTQPPPAYTGYVPYPQPQQTNVVVAQPTVTVVRAGGNCPRCGIGILTEEYSTLGIILAVLFFPWGILCCLAMQEKRCSSCGSSF